MAVCMSGVLFLSSGQAIADYLREEALQRNLQDEWKGATQMGPEFSGHTATCTLPSDSARRNGTAATITALTLSKENLSATLKCAGKSYVAISEQLKTVCLPTVSEPTVAKCKAHKQDSVITQVGLHALLDGNVVTCAYGQDSNHDPMKMEMTTEKNTLTISYGTDGSLHSKSYTIHYCDPQQGLQKYEEKDYVGIIPAFVERWWTKVDETGSSTLTMP
ncbi:SAG-related sequence SRS40B [Toxoplasma gondii TgCatPRC2]|uniref:SAG-related sequence SRS40B n=1 Tax=Toxoplasma gondii TgCatPRC2 TaxID=1130821 RepID=A0A151HQZ2_TOXGO|nr:SAG-related sequence SRS40B [Toxoplasma gondii TgCatPRC2]